MNAYYSFLPYIRTGLSNYLTATDLPDGTSPTERSNFTLNIGVEGQRVSGGTQNSTISKEFALKGPGDVIGINKEEIIKVSPTDWVTNFEPNYLPFIEFYDEDFCWRYTPAKFRKDGSQEDYAYRLRPWVTLVVLMDDEFELLTTPQGKPYIKIKKAAGEIFPSQDSLWAWAHVHVNENLATGDDAIGNTDAAIAQAVNKLKNTVLKRNPEKVISRLVSPRRLLPNKGYTAFLIPTFETGRRTGMGLEPFSGTSVQEQQGAWDIDTPIDTEFPVYHQWYFKTGDSGDFETLVRLVKPRVLGQDVGKREVDLQKSNNPRLESVTPPEPTIHMRGIAEPLNASDVEEWDLTDANPYTEKLRELINEPTKVLDQEGIADPIIAPPIYGRWHAAQDEVDEVTSEANWMQEANLDPRYRIFAGAGTETIRRNQEDYMNIAWEQVGEVMEANRKLNQLRLTKNANIALYNRHLIPLQGELLLNISAPAHQRIIDLQKQYTVFRGVDHSRIPTTVLSGAFRRITRAGSSLIKNIQINTGSISTVQLLSELNSGAIQIDTPYQPPAGQIPYNIWPPQQLTPEFTLSLQPNAGFQFSDSGVVISNPAPGTISPPVQTMLESIAGLHQVIQNLPPYLFSQNPALPMASVRDIILTRTEPITNAIAVAKNFIKLHNVKGEAIAVMNTNRIMAAPKIRTPMYEDLARLSPDWIMPGLGNIEMNSINLLNINQKYLEAYMLGLNYEMGRELMWRGYPTDQRGTYFSFFWGYNDSITDLVIENPEEQIYDLDNYRDIEDIHKWRTNPNSITSPLTALGSNSGRADGPPLLVMTIRAELLRKYPGTIIYLQKAEFVAENEPRRVIEGSEVYPLFSGRIEPDIVLLGFPITAEEVRGTGFGEGEEPGYFVVFKERSTEIRFGADETSTPAPTNIASWDEVSWGNLKDQPAEDGFINLAKTINSADNPDEITWGWNGATIAYALHQSPVKLNVHGQDLVPDSESIQ